jgi:hypothetical protein
VAGEHPNILCPQSQVCDRRAPSATSARCRARSTKQCSRRLFPICRYITVQKLHANNSTS